LFIEARTDASSSTIEITGGVGKDDTVAEPFDMYQRYWRSAPVTLTQINATQINAVNP
jgi:hypothetical protein